MKRNLLIGLVLFTVLFVGCGKGFVPLGGKVTFEDGSPLTVGAVCFSTGTFMAEGRLNEQGEYVLSSLGKDDGLPPGTYKVYIQGATKTDAKERTVDLIHSKFVSPDTTPLSYDVKKGGDNVYDIQVTKP